MNNIRYTIVPVPSCTFNKKPDHLKSGKALEKKHWGESEKNAVGLLS
jgi:hypothetical protein